jgi:hypothetical protein
VDVTRFRLGFDHVNLFYTYEKIVLFACSREDFVNIAGGHPRPIVDQLCKVCVVAALGNDQMRHASAAAIVYVVDRSTLSEFEGQPFYVAR